jgi:hypothetical protein
MNQGAVIPLLLSAFMAIRIYTRITMALVDSGLGPQDNLPATGAFAAMSN